MAVNEKGGKHGVTQIRTKMIKREDRIVLL